MTDAARAREFLTGYVNLAQLDPAVGALAAEFAEVRLAQHRATAELIRSFFTRDKAASRQQYRDCRVFAATVESTARNIRDAPPPEPADD